MTSWATYKCKSCKEYTKVLPESPHRDRSKRRVRSGCECCGRICVFVWFRVFLLRLATRG